jgi:hypothetical protein
MSTGSHAATTATVDGSGWRERRGLLAAAFIVACVGLGAALGAGIHPTSSSFRAASSVSVSGEEAGLHATSWRTAAQALRLAPIRVQIARLTGESASSLRVGVTGDPQSALITVVGDAATPSQAELLANSAATVTVNFLRQAGQGSTVNRSSFEHSSEAWNLGSGLYVLTPRRVASTRTPAHSGTGSLEVECDTLVTGGCGPFLRIEGAFHAGVTYEATGWFDARPATRLRLVLGSTPQDVAVGATLRGNSRWQPVSATWTPRVDRDLAIAAFQVMSLGTSRFHIDDVVIGPRSTLQRGARPAPSTVRYETVLPATSAERLYNGDTSAWAAAGAGAGLLVGAVALAAASQARRRRETGEDVDGQARA